jgi:CheY-like chemotaxis protein
MNEKPNIVIADDEVHILRVLDLKLSGNGFGCTKAYDGVQAWEAIFRLRPDLVISDYQMPRLNGLELAEKMFADPELRGIPVVLLTARGFSLTARDLEETNILYRVSKPFSPRELLSLVEEVLMSSMKGG